MIKNNPIGVFDSGLGGLTVVKELITQFPHEDIVYFGDTARVPYGTKSRSSIIRFSCENAAILLKSKVKMIVVACNSSSSYAIRELKKNFQVPIIGVIEAGAKAAIEQTKKNHIGVIATAATIESGSYPKKIRQFSKNISVYTNACPLFVPLVEEGWADHAVTKDIARQYLLPLKKEKIDALILGCTHYPLLKPVLRRVMGASVILIDSAREVAISVNDVLMQREELTSRRRKGKIKVMVSDRPQRFEELAKRFLGQRFLDVRRVQHV